MSNTLSKDGLGYTSSKANKEIWIKREVLQNGKMYYLMILIYVDGVLVVLKYNSTAIDYLAKICVLKEGSNDVLSPALTI